MMRVEAIETMTKYPKSAKFLVSFRRQTNRISLLAMVKPVVIIASLTEPVWRAVPMQQTRQPSQMVFLRPHLLPRMWHANKAGIAALVRVAVMTETRLAGRILFPSACSMPNLAMKAGIARTPPMMEAS